MYRIPWILGCPWKLATYSKLVYFTYETFLSYLYRGEIINLLPSTIIFGKKHATFPELKPLKIDGWETIRGSFCGHRPIWVIPQHFFGGEMSPMTRCWGI